MNTNTGLKHKTTTKRQKNTTKRKSSHNLLKTVVVVVVVVCNVSFSEEGLWDKRLCEIQH